MLKKRKVRFKERKCTLSILCVYASLGAIGYDELYLKTLRRGEFELPVHKFIDKKGEVFEGRGADEEASDIFKQYKTAFCLLIDAKNSKEMNPEQEKALTETLEFVKLFYGVDKVRSFIASASTFTM